MSQRFTVSASSRSDGELGEINQLFEGDEPNPSSSDKEGAPDLAEDPANVISITNISNCSTAELKQVTAGLGACMTNRQIRVIRDSDHISHDNVSE
ncbi:hypothetical protein Baya_8228 [Bagarius yarrelli]|uniref:Uncharacterized protein n=1 Tax=Bagarius yarrelli TaxID=175774 RepID=A0A556U3K2_BAGYA|nr:hypothetical protein Baya_8228 [Bagarius yarrelli]